MVKFTLEMDIKELIERMPLQKRIELLRTLEKETWASRLDAVVNKIRRHVKRIPTEKELASICKKARKKVYEKHQSGH